MGRPHPRPVIGLGFELGIAPLVNMRQALLARRTREWLALAVDHALYGLVLSEIRPAHKAGR